MKEWGDPLFYVCTAVCAPSGRGESVAEYEKPAGRTVSVCYDLAKPVTDELGLDLWDVRFVKEGASWYLRYIIDKDGGVSIDDCVALSRRMESLLDEADPIPHAYCLEVESHGLNRELIRPAHFAAYEGAPVTVRLIRALDGRREFMGTLRGLRDGAVILADEEGNERTFPRQEISRVEARDDTF